MLLCRKSSVRATCSRISAVPVFFSCIPNRDPLPPPRPTATANLNPLADPSLFRACGRSGWGGSRLPLTSARPQQQQGVKRDRDSHSSEESELSTLASAVVVEDDGDLSPPALNRQQEERPRFQQHHLQQQQHQRVSFADERGQLEVTASRVNSSTTASATASASRGGDALSFLRSITGAGNGNGGSTNSGRGISSSTNRPALTVSVDDGDAVGGQGGVGVGVGSNGISLRSPACGGLRSPGTAGLTVGVGGTSSIQSRVSAVLPTVRSVRRGGGDGGGGCGGSWTPDLHNS